MYDLARDAESPSASPLHRHYTAAALPPLLTAAPAGRSDDVRLAPDRGRAATANVRRHFARASVRVGVLLVADVAALGVTLAAAQLLAGLPAAAEAAATVMRLFAAAGGVAQPWDPAAALVVALAASGSYGPGDRRRDPSRLLLGCALGVALLVWAAERALPGSDLMHLAALLLVAPPVVLGRLLLDRVVRRGARLRRTAPRVLFVGRGAECLEAMGRSAFDVETGAQIVGIVDAGDATGAALRDFERTLTEGGVDTVVLCGQLDEAACGRVIRSAIAAECEVLAAVRTFEINGVRPSVVWRRGQPLVELRAVALRGQQLFLKRLLDVIGASVLLALLAPVLAAIAIAVRLDSSGPAVFGQRRLGRHGRVFRCFKFRSMHADAEQRLRDDPALHAEYLRNDFKLPEDRDPRITPVGRILRKTSLDELPQLWNVLRGDMSLVGPRPIVPDELRHYGGEEPLFLSLRPGITGAWQVAGRSNLPYPGRATIELDYVQGWTLWSDLRILLLTVPAVLLQRGAH